MPRSRISVRCQMMRLCSGSRTIHFEAIKLIQSGSQLLFQPGAYSLGSRCLIPSEDVHLCEASYAGHVGLQQVYIYPDTKHDRLDSSRGVRALFLSVFSPSWAISNRRLFRARANQQNQNFIMAHIGSILNGFVRRQATAYVINPVGCYYTPKYFFSC